MPKIDIVNLIPYHSGKAPETLSAVTPQRAAERIRAACADQGADFAEWCRGILEHCIIPSEHPYRTALKKRKVPDDDPLWVLGAIAYGTQSPWIGFRRIAWDDGTMELPDELERKWIAKQGAL